MSCLLFNHFTPNISYLNHLIALVIIKNATIFVYSIVKLNSITRYFEPMIKYTCEFIL